MSLPFPITDNTALLTTLIVVGVCIAIIVYILNSDLSRLINNKAVKTLHESVSYVADYDRVNGLVGELLKPIVPQKSEKEKQKILQLIEKIEGSLEALNKPAIETSNITSLLNDVKVAITTPKLLDNVTFDPYYEAAMKQVLELLT